MARPLRFQLILIAALCVLMFAGIQPSAAQANLPSWTEMAQHGAIPNPVWDGASTYHDGMFYVFGGLNGTFPNDEPVRDFSVFDVETLTWHSLSQHPGGPSARAEAMMWYVPESQSLMVSGGRGPFRRNQELQYRDTFRFQLPSGWSAVPQKTTEAAQANRSTEAVAVPKTGAGRKTVAYAFSGSSSTLPAFINRPDGLQSNLVRYKQGWKAVAVAAPVPRARAHFPLVYAPNAHALFLYGGYTNDAVNGTGLFTPENYLGDLWRFDLRSATWVQLVFDQRTGPGPRDNAKLIVDEHQNRLWLFGGSTFDGTTLSDLWYFDLHTRLWTRVDTAMIGPAPAPRFGQFYFARETDTAYEFFIFGGATAEFNPILLNDMWRLTIPFGADDADD